MSKLLLINTPQYDYIENSDNKAQAVKHNILTHLLYDDEFMKDVDVTGLVLDFFPMTNEHYDDVNVKDMRCLSFTLGASIDNDISNNLHRMQECAIKKLPKNDREGYERSVLDNIDSATFLIELLNKDVDEVYFCGFSIDNSISATLRLFMEFLPSDRLHVIKDLIYCEDSNEYNAIDIYCLDNNIKQHNFANI